MPGCQIPARLDEFADSRYNEADGNPFPILHDFDTLTRRIFPMKYVLGIDLGTSGTKTVLFDQYGTAVCSALVEYPLYQPHNGWAEQKPEDWYHAAVDTIRSVLTKSGVDKKDVVSMGISGQMHGLVMLDAYTG